MTSKCSLRDSTRSSTSSRFSVRIDGEGNAIPLTTYRIGSVSQDTNLCLWDITSDVLNSHLNRNRTSSYIARNSVLEINCTTPVAPASPSAPGAVTAHLSGLATHSVYPGSSNSVPNLPSLPSPQPSISNGGAKVKRNFTLGHRDKNSLRSTAAATQCMKNTLELQSRLLGTQYCPRLHEVPLLEPLTCKKLARSMLTSIQFYKDFIVVACQEGVISCYARPHKQVRVQTYVQEQLS